jgi:UDP-3-O-[3-hydroxymyristoyl] glucosamine N-acyltransferase
MTTRRPTVRVLDLAELLGATFEGDGERTIAAAAPLESAGAADISFVVSARARREAAASAAGCLVVPPDLDLEGRTLIRARHPRNAFARVIRHLHPAPAPSPGIHPTAIVPDSAQLAPGVSIGAYAVIGERCVLGENSSVGAHSVLGDDVHLGPSCLLHARVTLYPRVHVGARAVIHSGAVLGAEGFGFVFENGRYSNFPQIGRLVVGDDVDIGANTTIDRAALGATVIEDGVKLDNLIHIGHNCRVGAHVVIAAQTGIAGGSVIEHHAVIGGQVGLGDNVTIQSGAILGSKCGVLPGKTLKGGGIVYWGVPAKPLKEYLESLALVGKLSTLRDTVRNLQSLLKGDS